MKASQSGYTLIEVVIAFTILALSLGVLFGSFSQALQRSDKARNMARAGLVAQSLRDSFGVSIAASAGDSEGAEDDCKWSLHTRPLTPPNVDHRATVAAYETSIEVRCGEPGRGGAAALRAVGLVPST